MAQASRLFSDFCCFAATFSQPYLCSHFQRFCTPGMFLTRVANCPLESCYPSSLPRARHGRPSSHAFVSRKVLSFENKSVNSRSKKLISSGCLNDYFFDYKLG